MSRWLSSVFIFILGLLLGSGLGWGSLELITRLDRSPTSSITLSLGVQHPWVMGFQPYWTLGKAQSATLAQLNSLVYFSLEIAPDGTLVRETKPGETEPGWLKLGSDDWSTLTTSKPLTPRPEQSLAVHASKEDAIAQLVADPIAHAHTLANALTPLMAQHHFTDLNLDVESFQPATPGARLAFTQFMQTLKADLNQGRPATSPITLTVDVAPIVFFQTMLIDPAQLASVADRVIIMGYDFHYRDSTVAGPVAPLGGAPTRYEFDVPMTLAQALHSIPRHKILLGIPFYGYEWETLRTTPESATIPGTGKTMSGPKVAELLSTCGATCQTGYQDDTQQPYFMIPSEEDEHVTRQIFYENAASLTAKLQLAEWEKLGGVAFWALGYDVNDSAPSLNAYAATVLSTQLQEP